MAIEVALTFECDYCGKTLKKTGSELPVGWHALFSVHAHQVGEYDFRRCDPDMTEERHACSQGCLEHLAVRLVREPLQPMCPAHGPHA